MADFRAQVVDVSIQGDAAQTHVLLCVARLNARTFQTGKKASISTIMSQLLMSTCNDDLQRKLTVSNEAPQQKVCCQAWQNGPCIEINLIMEGHLGTATASQGFAA